MSTRDREEQYEQERNTRPRLAMMITVRMRQGIAEDGSALLHPEGRDSLDNFIIRCAMDLGLSTLTFFGAPAGCCAI